MCSFENSLIFFSSRRCDPIQGKIASDYHHLQHSLIRFKRNQMLKLFMNRVKLMSRDQCPNYRKKSFLQYFLNGKLLVDWKSELVVTKYQKLDQMFFYQCQVSYK